MSIANYENFREAVRQDPARGRFTFKATTQWLGGTRAVTRARDFSITTDEPEALGGTDSAPDPVELFLASATTCLQIGIVTQAALRKIELKELIIEAEGDLDVRGYLGDDQVAPGYNQVKLKVHIEGNASQAELRELVEVAQRHSPMLDSVRRSVPIEAEVAVQGS
ncbi:MAG TPA: OsmC family protein [Bacillota bacterium]